MATDEEPIELELIRSAVATDVKVTKTEKKPTSADDAWVRIDGRLGDEEEDDVEWAAMGFIFAVSAFSFADARPRGVSDMHFDAADEWTAVDALRRIRFVRGELHFSADYVRGRCMKTDLEVRRDGTFTLTTTNRGEAATRWIGRLQGKKPLAPVKPDSAPGNAVATTSLALRPDACAMQRYSPLVTRKRSSHYRLPRVDGAANDAGRGSSGGQADAKGT